MIHFLLLLLKIIGIIIAGLLGLLLLLVLTVLLVPVRYRGRIQKTSDGVFVRGTVSWLLHLVQAELCYGKEGLHYRLRLAGIPFGKSTNRAEPEPKPEAEPKPQSEAEPESPPKQEPPEPESPPEAEAEPKSEQPKPKQNSEAEPKPEPKPKPEPPKAEQPKSERTAHRKKETVFLKLKRVGEVLRRQENKEFLRLFFSKMGKLLRHLLPRKLSGRVVFGSGDPCLTGQLLGVISIVYAKCGKLLDLTPDFEEKRLELDVTVRGKLRMGTLCIIVLPVVFDRRGRRMIREIKKAWK